ncbi:MAG TPA: ABC transporter permease [Bauldia sp.]|nr:ABC transporter permease [Bauldia sp.]
MVRFLGLRLAASLVALVGVLVLVFFLARLTGSPAALYLPADATDEMVEAFNRQNGLDRPLPVQFVRFVGDTLNLDFGRSISQQRPAIVAVLESMPQTVLLAAVAMALTLLAAIPLGVLAALYADRALDRGITFFSLLTASIPDFWFALVCVLVFSVDLGWLPTSGQLGLSSWVLPLATLMLHPVGVLTQVVRGAMLEPLHAGYIQNARARGYSWGRLAFRHALRNASLPIITVAGDRAGGMLNGAVIVSAVFAWPGIGQVLVSAVYNRDFAVIQAGVFVVGVSIILLNILVDLIYALADPRVRLA